MRSFASSLLALSAATLVLAGCGEQATFEPTRVQAAFADNGIKLGPAQSVTYYYRPDLDEIVDEAFFRLQDFISRPAEVSRL